MNLLITDVQIVAPGAFTSGPDQQAVAISDNKIVAVGPQPALEAAYPDHERLDGEGRLLLPGLINAHMHFYGFYARGLGLTRPMTNFGEILQYLWWRLDRALDRPAIYYSALLPAISAVRSGVTTIIDHHASPNAIEGSLDVIEEALTQVGLRAILCYEVTDRNGRAGRAAGLAENGRYLQKCEQARAADPTYPFDGLVGLHAAFTLEDETLAQASDLAHMLGRGCHVHLLEDQIDDAICLDRYQAGAVERLRRFGVLGRRTLAAHAIHLDTRAAGWLAESETLIAHNPQSNMNNAVGRADIFDLLRRGVAVGLGTDGMTPDVRAEARAAHLLHRHHLHDPTVAWGEVERLLLVNNPTIVERTAGWRVGRIAPGYLADLILVDYSPPTPLSSDNLWGHFLFGLVDARVHTSIINGRVVMRGGVFPHLDEAALAAASRACARRVWERFASLD